MTECCDEGRCAEQSSLPAANPTPRPSAGVRLPPDQILAALEQVRLVFLWVDTFFGEHGCYVLVDKKSLACEIKIAADNGWKVTWLAELRHGNSIWLCEDPSYGGAR